MEMPPIGIMGSLRADPYGAQWENDQDRFMNQPESDLKTDLTESYLGTGENERKLEDTF